MLELVAYLFRALNAKLVTVQNLYLQKALKLSFLISFKFKKKFQKLGNKSLPYTINNFDVNLKIKIDRSKAIGSSLFWTGFHELKELIFLHHYLIPEMIAIDVGSNIGEYTIFLAKRLKKGKVIAFEPMPPILSTLRENIAINHFTNVEIMAVGLADKKGKIEIHELEDDKNEGLSTIYLGNRKSRNTFIIDITTLDSLELKIDRLDFLKIDIEGAEIAALNGAKETLLRFRPLVMVEVSDITYHQAGYSSSDVRRFFTEIGYEAFIVGKQGTLLPLPQLPAFGNIFFVPS
jgi:FkbM family methyltransferase